MANELISKDEVTKERTPSELMVWFKCKNEQIYSTSEGRKALRLHEGRVKQFMEEIYPLAIFGERKFGNTNQILITPVIGSQNYDAILTDLRSKPPSQSYVEITQSHEGENEYLRALELHNRGLVFRYGKVSKTRTKRTGIQVLVEPGCASVEEAAKDDLENIRAAAEKKAGKDYPADTSLIIFFDDTLHFPRVIDDAQLDNFVNRNILNLDLMFSTLYLIGWKNVFREYSLVKRP